MGAPGSADRYVSSGNEEELHEEEQRDGIRQQRNILALARAELEHGIADQTQTDAVTDRAGDRHGDEHDCHRQALINVVKVDLLETAEHQQADVNERGAGRGGGDDGGNGREEHTRKEEQAGRQGGQTRAAAGLHAGGGLDERGDGGGTGASGGIASDSYLKDPDCNPSQTTNVGGADIVAYAQQFVGNPYVWGGNSLTNGVDCSGFVHLVYAHFGISTPRYSQAFKSVGQPVSYQNIQAGDVVVYPGHVAIYIGNGNIVEAQSTRAGITNSRPVNCHTITAIRRLV